MNLLIIIIGLIVIAGIVARYNHSQFIGISDDEIEFSWKFRVVGFNRDSIDEIFISKIEGKLLGFYIISNNRQFNIKSKEISEQEMKNFAIRNNITIKCEEGYHGGGVFLIYKSKEKK